MAAAPLRGIALEAIQAALVVVDPIHLLWSGDAIGARADQADPWSLRGGDHAFEPLFADDGVVVQEHHVTSLRHCDALVAASGETAVQVVEDDLNVGALRGEVLEVVHRSVA
ncbi:hypothetical protein D3C86_1754070 [compost metagenome]